MKKDGRNAHYKTNFNPGDGGVSERDILMRNQQSLLQKQLWEIQQTKRKLKQGCNSLKQDIKSQDEGIQNIKLQCQTLKNLNTTMQEGQTGLSLDIQFQKQSIIQLQNHIQDQRDHLDIFQAKHLLINSSIIVLDQDDIKQINQNDIFNNRCRFFPKYNSNISKYVIQHHKKGIAVTRNSNDAGYLKLCNHKPFPSKGRFCYHVEVLSIPSKDLLIGVSNTPKVGISSYQIRKQYYFNFANKTIEYNNEKISSFENKVKQQSKIILMMDMDKMMMFCIVDQQNLGGVSIQNLKKEQLYFLISLSCNGTTLYFENL